MHKRTEKILHRATMMAVQKFIAKMYDLVSEGRCYHRARIDTARSGLQALCHTHGSNLHQGVLFHFVYTISGKPESTA